MKKSTIILIITGVLCSIVSIVCICAAAVRLADLGVSFAETNINGREYVWDSYDDGNSWSTDNTWDSESSYDGTSSENVDVNLPFINVHVNKDNVQVSLPGIMVDVNDDTDKVSVKIGGDETDTTAVTTSAADATTAAAPSASVTETSQTAAAAVTETSQTETTKN